MNKISEWARPILELYKRLADAKWHKSETIHYGSFIFEYDDGIRLKIELGPKEREDVPGSWHWYSVGYVIPSPFRGDFIYKVKYPNEVYETVDGWDGLISTLESDLEEYKRKMIKALQKNIEQAIDKLPG